MSYLVLSCSFCLFVVTFCWCLIGFRLSLSLCGFLSAACCFSRVIDYWLGMAICDLLWLFRSPIFYCHPSFIPILVITKSLLLPSLVAVLLYCYIAISCIARCGSRLVVSQSILSTPIHSLHAISLSPRQFVVASVGSSSNFAKWLPGSADGVLLVSSALADAAFVCAAITPGSGLACAPSPMG